MFVPSLGLTPHKNRWFFAASRTWVWLLLLLLAGPAWGAEPVTVTIDGVADEMLENVQAAIAVPFGLTREGAIDRPWLDRFRLQIPERVRAALEPYGYFSARTEVTVETPSPDEVVLLVQVQPGAAVRLDAVKVALAGPGRNEPKLRMLADSFPLHQGDILRQDHYEQAKGALIAQAVDLGYLYASFERHLLVVDRDTLRSEIELELDTGPLLFFESVLIHGAPNYPDPFLRRYLDFQEGERFSYHRLGQTQINYLDSDRFKDVLITPHLELVHEQSVPISIQLVPSDRRRLRPGIGYGTDTGPRASLRYQDVNIFHLGHELKIDTSVSTVKQEVEANYLIPSPTALQNVTALRFNLKSEKTDTYTSRLISTELERIHSLGPGLLGSLFLRLLDEDYRVGLTNNRSYMVLPGGRFSAHHFSDPVHPREGFLFGMEIRGTHPVLGSDSKLFQVLGNADYLLPLPWRLSLLTRGQCGTTLVSDKLAEIPTSLRFFAGGDKSVRGYAYQSLGPTDASGKVVGGKHMLAGSLELERGIFKDWGIASFYDVGNAFNAPGNVAWAQGAGLGVRYYSVVGPLRLDVAKRFGHHRRGYRLHISVGLSW